MRSRGQEARLNIYVASSWRNGLQPMVVSELREFGYEVYDFRHPKPGNNGFHWHDIDPLWSQWTADLYVKALRHPLAEAGFSLDWSAMERADACVLVLPCGASAHLEAGYFRGAGKPLFILLADGEPELMYKMADKICTNLREVVDSLEGKT